MTSRLACVVIDAKVAKNRQHLDLRADGSATADELERLIALGARKVDVGQGRDVTWVVLAEPEGNEFCLLECSMQDLAPAVRTLTRRRQNHTDYRCLLRSGLGMALFITIAMPTPVRATPTTPDTMP